MGKTRNQHQPQRMPAKQAAGRPTTGALTDFRQLRGASAPPPAIPEPLPGSEREMSIELAWERLKELLPDGSDSQDFIERAKEASGAGSAPHQVSEQRNNYLATSVDGALYWYHDGLVFISPVYVNNIADLDNCAACGESDGAELDIYGLECQISAALCRRQLDFASAAMYQALSDYYYQRADEEQYMHWPNPERDRPTVPRVV